MSQGSQFYTGVPDFTQFGEVARAEHYRRLPDDWWIGVTDVVDSTAAVTAGRYKAVNVAGAAAIGAVSNALAPAPFPFVFGGDGASFAVWNEGADVVRDALARTVRWVADELGLELRASLVPVGLLRAEGSDVAVARFRAGAHVHYAMFAGGGVDAAVCAMKSGRHRVDPAPIGAHPDLTGLSCRWMPIPARHGTIVSLIVVPAAGANLASIAPVLERVLALVAALDREGHPVPVDGPPLGWPPEGAELEARASRRAGRSLARARLGVWFATAFARLLDVTRWRLGGFDPLHYRRTTTRNADYRKFDDGLRLTIDCDDATLAAIERLLDEAAAAGRIRFGLHRQASALMTCFVPSPFVDTHVHFIDGADGGYTRAAAALKARR